jgi:hypothetical protein
VKRKSVTYLNQLRVDVQDVLDEISEIGFDIEAAASNLALQPVSNLTSPDDCMKETFNELALRHRDMGKLLVSFRKVRSEYLDFF